MHTSIHLLTLQAFTENILHAVLGPVIGKMPPLQTDNLVERNNEQNKYLVH